MKIRLSSPASNVTAGRAQFVPGAVVGRPVRKVLLAVDSRAAFIAAILGAAVVFVIGIPLAGALNIWLDEAFTLHTTGSGVMYAWSQAIAFETQPPLYFVLEAAWRGFNESSIAFARVPSVVSAALGVVIIVVAAHRIAPRIPPLAVALVTALNPLVLWAAVELRLYALVFLIGALLTWLFFEAFLTPNPSRIAQIAYCAIAIVGLYTQYYVGFVLLAHGLTLVAVRRSALRSFAVTMAVVAVAFAPFIRIAMRHVSFSAAYVSRLSPASVVHHMVDAVFVFVLPHELWWHGAWKFAGFCSTAALLVALFSMGAPELRKPVHGIVVGWLASIATLSLLFILSGAPIDLLRHVIIIAPPSMLVVYLVFSSVTRQRALLGIVAATLFAVFSSTTLWARYHPPLRKVGDWQRVATRLRHDARETPIAVFPADLTLLLSAYQPVLRPIPIPAAMPFTLDYDRAMTLNDEPSVARVLDPVRAKSAQLWVVTPGPCTAGHVDYDYHCRYLQTYLHRRYRIMRSVVFSGALAELYTRLPPPAVPESAKHAN